MYDAFLQNKASVTLTLVAAQSPCMKRYRYAVAVAYSNQSNNPNASPITLMIGSAFGLLVRGTPVEAKSEPDCIGGWVCGGVHSPITG